MSESEYTPIPEGPEDPCNGYIDENHDLIIPNWQEHGFNNDPFIRPGELRKQCPNNRIDITDNRIDITENLSLEIDEKPEPILNVRCQATLDKHGNLVIKDWLDKESLENLSIRPYTLRNYCGYRGIRLPDEIPTLSEIEDKEERAIIQEEIERAQSRMTDEFKDMWEINPIINKDNWDQFYSITSAENTQYIIFNLQEAQEYLKSQDATNPELIGNSLWDQFLEETNNAYEYLDKNREQIPRNTIYGNVEVPIDWNIEEERNISTFNSDDDSAGALEEYIITGNAFSLFINGTIPEKYCKPPKEAVTIDTFIGDLSPVLFPAQNLNCRWGGALFHNTNDEISYDEIQKQILEAQKDEDFSESEEEELHNYIKDNLFVYPFNDLAVYYGVVD